MDKVQMELYAVLTNQMGEAIVELRRHGRRCIMKDTATYRISQDMLIACGCEACEAEATIRFCGNELQNLWKQVCK